ncbi:MAG: hypothetical protein K0B15_00195 [Lentimicrobium sp.]|nr:hypothetical protein [Lentimicrobium sp.]
MHEIEPFYGWRNLYDAALDAKSPFYGREYSEYECINSVYNYYIHPLWDEMGSATLYIKLLYVDYNLGFGVIEFLGEWNDLLYNDIMFLKRNVIEPLNNNGIDRFILIGENILNFHADDNSYYQEWYDEIEDGWIACVNFRAHVLQEIRERHLDYYLATGGNLDYMSWRTLSPAQLLTVVDGLITKRLS